MRKTLEDDPAHFTLETEEMRVGFHDGGFRMNDRTAKLKQKLKTVSCKIMFPVPARSSLDFVGLRKG